MTIRYSSCLVGAVLVAQVSVAQSAIIQVRNWVEAPTLIERTTFSNGLLVQQETGGNFGGDWSLAPTTFDTVTGELTIPFKLSGTLFAPTAGGPVTWETEEVVTIQTFDPTDTGTRATVSCVQGQGSFVGFDVCDQMTPIGDFGLESLSIIWNAAGTQISELHISAYAQVWGVSFSSTTIDYVVPVPAAAWLFGSALLSLPVIRRRQRG